VKTCKKVGSCYEWDSYVSCDSDEKCEGGQCVPECDETDYWSPTFDSQTDSTGKQKDTSINVSIKIEVKQDGKGLQFRICKGSGTFSSNVYFSITDGASNKAYRTISSLSTKGKSCSSWYDLYGDTSYTTGQQFGGMWKVISPNTSVSDWNGGSGCSPKSNAGGTCWNGVNITMTRTCKL
jgi:hypothetical protein